MDPQLSASPPRDQVMQRPTTPLSDALLAQLRELAVFDARLGEQLATTPEAFALDEDAQFATDLAVYDRLSDVLSPAPLAIYLFSGRMRDRAIFAGASMVREAQRRYDPESVLILVLDQPSPTAADHLPQGSRICDLVASAPELTPTQLRSFVLRYISACKPAVTVNCDSAMGWDLFTGEGAALARVTGLGAFVFGTDAAEQNGAVGGDAGRLPEALPHLSWVVSDREDFCSAFETAFVLPSVWVSKIHTLHPPIHFGTRPGQIAWDTKRRPKIGWAQRMMPSARPEIVAQIARSRPQYDFVMYGDFPEGESYAAAQFTGKNLSHGGAFKSLGALPIGDFDAFLNTGLGEHLPETVLAAGALGLPVVSSASGLARNILDDETAALAPLDAGASDYAAVIDGVVKDPAKASLRALALYTRLAERYNPVAYRRRLMQLDILPEPVI